MNATNTELSGDVSTPPTIMPIVVKLTAARFNTTEDKICGGISEHTHVAVSVMESLGVTHEAIGDFFGADTKWVVQQLAVTNRAINAGDAELSGALQELLANAGTEAVMGSMELAGLEESPNGASTKVAAEAGVETEIEPPTIINVTPRFTEGTSVPARGQTRKSRRSASEKEAEGTEASWDCRELVVTVASEHFNVARGEILDIENDEGKIRAICVAVMKDLGAKNGSIQDYFQAPDRIWVSNRQTLSKKYQDEVKALKKLVLARRETDVLPVPHEVSHDETSDQSEAKGSEGSVLTPQFVLKVAAEHFGVDARKITHPITTEESEQRAQTVEVMILVGIKKPAISEAFGASISWVYSQRKVVPRNNEIETITAKVAKQLKKRPAAPAASAPALRLTAGSPASPAQPLNPLAMTPSVDPRKVAALVFAQLCGPDLLLLPDCVQRVTFAKDVAVYCMAEVPHVPPALIMNAFSIDEASMNSAIVRIRFAVRDNPRLSQQVKVIQKSL